MNITVSLDNRDGGALKVCLGQLLIQSVLYSLQVVMKWIMFIVMSSVV